MYTYEENLVSLVTPGWNGKSFIHRLLDSILKQTYRPIEYIYVDDGSTDGTTEIVKSYAPKFKEAEIEFKFIRQENGGISEALLRGFQEVRGRYLSCPEYDDILFPFSIEKKVQYLKEHIDCAVVTADAWIVTEDDLTVRKNLLSHHNPNRFDRNHFYQSLMSNSIFNAACQLIRMDLYDSTHPKRQFYSSRLAPNQQILLPLYYNYSRGFIEEPLSLYVMRSNSLSCTAKTYENTMLDLDEYKKILFKTLDAISMSDEDRVLYKRRVEINVNKDYLYYAYVNRDISSFNKAFNYLQEQKELNKDFYEYKRKLQHLYILKLETQAARLHNIFSALHFRLKKILTKK